MLTEDIIFQQNKEIKQGLTDLAISLAPTHNIDFAFNQDRSIEGIRKDLNRFLMRVETNMLGKFFYRKPADERIKSICFVEHIETNIHYHGLLRIPQHFHDRFTNKAIKAWLKICPSGSLKITPIQTDPEIFIKSNYAHKEIYKLQNYENFVLHSEFWSFKK